MLIRALVYAGFLLVPVPSLVVVWLVYRPGVLLAEDYDPGDRSPFEPASHPLAHFASPLHAVLGALAFFVPMVVTLLVYVFTVDAVFAL